MGADASAARKAAKAEAAVKPYTLADLLDAYVTEHAERHQRPTTLRETRRALKVHWRRGRPAGGQRDPARCLGASGAGAHQRHGVGQSGAGELVGSVRLGHSGRTD